MSVLGKGTANTSTSGGGTDFEWEVEHSGWFWAPKYGLRAETLMSLREKVGRKVAGARARFEVRYFDTVKQRHRVVTGIHAATGQLLVRTDGEKGVEQLMYSQVHGLRPLDSDEVAERKAIVDDYVAARRALDGFDSKRRLDVAAAVRREVEAEKAKLS